MLKLKKSLYDLKNSPKKWNNKFNETMSSIDFVRSVYEYCLSVRIDKNTKIYLLLYVSDLLLADTDFIEVEDIKNTLSKYFKMKDLGPVSHFLGVDIKQNMLNNKITLHQTGYLKSIIAKINVQDCKSVKTPTDRNFDHSLLREKCSKV